MRNFYFPTVLMLALLPLTAAPAATIDLPQTGQTQCYDASGGARACSNTGEDADYQAGVAVPGARFSVDATGQCIIDNLTGLMWTQDANLPGRQTWGDALSYANNLQHCGYDDWRMPNRLEMMSLMTNVAVPDVAGWLATQGFSNLDAAYWTSTTVAGTEYAWFVNSNGGEVARSLKDSPDCTVWPVRGGH